MGKVSKSNTCLLILDPEVRLWNEKLKRFRKNEKKQTITLSIAAGNYDTEIIIDLINQTIQDFWVKYQDLSIGLKKLPIFSPLKISVKFICIRLFLGGGGRVTSTHNKWGCAILTAKIAPQNRGTYQKL